MSLKTTFLRIIDHEGLVVVKHEVILLLHHWLPLLEDT